MKRFVKALSLVMALATVATMAVPGVIQKPNETTANAVSNYKSLYSSTSQVRIVVADSSNGLYIRKTANPDGAKITCASTGTVMRYLDYVKGTDGKYWYKVQWDGSTVGYCSAAYSHTDTCKQVGILRFTSCFFDRDADCSKHVKEAHSGWYPAFKRTGGDYFVVLNQTYSSSPSGAVGFPVGYGKSGNYYWDLFPSSVTSMTRAKYKVTAANGINLRYWPSQVTGSGGTLTKNATCYVVGKVHNSGDGYDWYKVENGSYYYWVQARYLTKA